MSKFIEITLSTGEVQMLNTRFIKAVSFTKKGQTEIFVHGSDKPVVTDEKYEVIRALLVDAR